VTRCHVSFDSSPLDNSVDGRGAVEPLVRRPGWLFDLDGTLVDSSQGVVRAFHAAQKALGEKAAEPAAIIRRIGYPLSDTIAALSRLPVEPFLKEFRAEALRSMADHSSLLPGARELLLGLERRQSTLGVVTSKRRDVACAVLDRLAILGFFQTVVGADCAPRVKPHPDPILEAVRRLGLPREQLVMVGDTRNDVEAAAAAGLPVIALLSGIDPPAELSGADLLLRDAAALLRAVEASGSRPVPRLITYTRSECPLCAELKDRLRAQGVRFEERDIRGSDVWYERFTLRVPVVWASGVEFDPPFGDDLLDLWSAQYP